MTPPRATPKSRLTTHILEYAGDFFSVVIGENNVTSPLEDRTSSLDIPFIERSSIINAYGYGRAAGVAASSRAAQLDGRCRRLRRLAQQLERATSRTDEQTSVSGRFTWAPIFETSPDGITLLHLGVSARQRSQWRRRATSAIRARPLNGRGTRWLESSGGTALRNDTAYGFEVAGQWNAFGFTAEYITLEATNAGRQRDSSRTAITSTCTGR